MQQPTPSIHLHDLNFGFFGKILFDQFSLEIPAKQCVCLLGTSGVGKSTLLRLIANLDGIKSQIDTPDRIAYMGQNDALMPWLSVLNNVLIGYRLRRELTDAIKERAIHLLEKVGLKNEIQALPTSLSGGMRQRVALVRTFIEDRSIVLMDEPFGALDIVNRLHLQDLTAKLMRNKTLLLVTHDPLEALRLADIVYILFDRPVKLSNPIHPPGKAARDPSDPEILTLQGQLIRQLQDKEFR